MSRLQDITNIGIIAVQRLRREKLDNGLTFMIFSEDLPSTHCYLEYPDGVIQIATVSKDSRDLAIIRNLSPHEVGSVRAKYNLY